MVYRPATGSTGSIGDGSIRWTRLSSTVAPPQIENAASLEVEHFGTGIVGLIRMPLEGELEGR